MKSPEGISFCDTCPQKGTCEGSLDKAEPAIATRLFSRRNEAGEEVPVHVPMGMYFYDAEGRQSEYFVPTATMEDVANCDKPLIIRSGLFKLRKETDCGANQASVVRLRKLISRPRN